MRDRAKVCWSFAPLNYSVVLTVLELKTDTFGTGICTGVLDPVLMVLPLVMTVLAALVRTVLVRTVLALLLMVQKILALTVLVLITALAHVYQNI